MGIQVYTPRQYRVSVEPDDVVDGLAVAYLTEGLRAQYPDIHEAMTEAGYALVSERPNGTQMWAREADIDAWAEAAARAQDSIEEVTSAGVHDGERGVEPAPAPKPAKGAARRRA